MAKFTWGMGASVNKSDRYGLVLFFLLSLLTAVVVATVPKRNQTLQPIKDVQIQTRLSQTKVLAGEMTELYLDVTLQAPILQTTAIPQQYSDLVVVLDRSGSMSGAEKMPYAKAAVNSLIRQMQQGERIALISFANQAILEMPFMHIDDDALTTLTARVDSIKTGGGTNIGAALSQAAQLIQQSPSENAVKVLLLSDGQANQGVNDVAGLSRLVEQITEQEAVLSAIGMGLDFNENLMSVLADYGMGNYRYLENLAGLGDLFAENLQATRQIYSPGSSIQLKLPKGVTLVDAGGYPVVAASAGVYAIKTGQLLFNAQKKFTMTFRVQQAEPGELNLAQLSLRYQRQGEQRIADITPEHLKLAVLASQRKQEAVASIDEDLYKESWIQNNFGRMQKQLSHWVKRGEKDKADQVLQAYRRDVAEAEIKNKVVINSKPMEANIKALEDSIEDTFVGTEIQKKEKRKRVAKSLQMSGMKEQRK